MIEDLIRRTVAEAVREELAPMIREAIEAALANHGAAQGDGEYLSTAQAAERLGLARATLEGWRALGKGPRYRKLGRRVVYARADLDVWANEQRTG